MAMHRARGSRGGVRFDRGQAGGRSAVLLLRSGASGATAAAAGRRTVVARDSRWRAKTNSNKRGRKRPGGHFQAHGEKQPKERTNELTLKVRREGEPMNQVKRFRPQSPANRSFPVHARQFVFFDKKTGTRRFEVKAGEDGSVCLDQAVNMLAVYCASRHQMPRDFNVMVMAGEEIVGDLMRRTTKLLRTCSGARTPSPLSPRQYQVLSGIAQDLSNKEIAAKLSLSERTVKVSRLRDARKVWRP
jgi:DNA-binding CsgD family transcriptional regulator